MARMRLLRAQNPNANLFQGKGVSAEALKEWQSLDHTAMLNDSRADEEDALSRDAHRVAVKGAHREKHASELWPRLISKC